MGYLDQIRPAEVFGKDMHFRHIGITSYTKDKVSALTGTAVTGGVTEAQIVTGGETIIITLTNGEFIRSGTLFNAQRQAMIDGCDSAQAEANGWDARIKAVMAVTAVVRTADNIITITTPAAALYAITANETITVTIPAAIMDGQIQSLVAGTFVITNA